MQKTYSGVVMFIQESLNKQDAHIFKAKIDSLFPSWTHLWQVLERWIRTAPLTDMPTSILSFAQMLPDYSSFSQKLQYSLTLHEDFWNKVYYNLVLAKQRLSSC